MRSLSELLEVYSVIHPYEHVGPTGWWGVSDGDGIIAYFAEEASAFRFRLSEINRVLNG